jgi:hypothetical protein
VTAAFKIILADPAVKGILVNIFGGIMKCDIIADGIVAAAKEVNLSVPLVVRLEGTNVQQGKDILANRACRSFPPTTWATRRRRSWRRSRAAPESVLLKLTRAPLVDLTDRKGGNAALAILFSARKREHVGANFFDDGPKYWKV